MRRTGPMTLHAPNCRRIGFLFNHDHVHQVAHSAPVAFELSLRQPDWPVTLIACSAAERAALERIAQRYPGHRCTLVTLDTPGVLGWLGARLDGLAPLRKLLLLKSNLEFFRAFDALVVPEKTTLLLRTRFGLDRLKLIHTRHGAGDRAVGFDGHSGQFDLVLLAGEKIRRRLSDAGQLREGSYAMVGYPKFDAVGALDSAQTSRRLFDNDRPTVLYNPHCSPHLSSWYAMGLDVLEYFYRSSRYNLIFAPHVMLYRRRLQISIDRFSLDWVRRIPERYRRCAHLHIDTGSSACTDMSYTLAADLYLGDVSSQVCEFLIRPRPCLFANAHGVAWRDDPCYSAWQLGPVFEHVSQLDQRLAEAFTTHADYLPLQQAYLCETFDLSATPSARRAATAIAEFLLREQAPDCAPAPLMNTVSEHLPDAA